MSQIVVISIIAISVLLGSCGKRDGIVGSRLFSAIWSGESHSCGKLSNGLVMCWGRNDFGQLGLGHTNNIGDDPSDFQGTIAAINIGNRSITSMALGVDHSCAIFDNGTVKCWGYNIYGQLGMGDTANRGDDSSETVANLPVVNLGTGRTAKAVTAGWGHTCAILDNDTVKCWGLNGNGQLGLDSGSSKGSLPSDMGDNLPIVNLGAGRTALAIDAGNTHTCALLDNSSVKCWGGGSVGALGQENNDISYGDTAGDMAALNSINLGTGRTAKAISAGMGISCAILDNDTLKCWGWNAAGQLGIGTNVNMGDAANTMGDNLPIVNLGTGRTARQVQTTSKFIFNVCALLDNNTVKCWGSNSFGALGLSATTPASIGAIPASMGDNLNPISLGTGRTAVNISMGDAYCCALLDTSQVKCWGRNVTAQLGLGDTINRGDKPGQMGDNLPVIGF